MSGPGDWTKVGGGMLVINQVNTFTGQTIINNGVVQVTAQTFALGSLVGTVVVNNGATMLVNNAGGQFAAKTVTISGTGFAGLNLAGALLFSQATTWDGNLIVTPGATVGVTAGNLILEGIVSGTADLVKVGAGTLSLVANNTFTGNLVVDGGTLQLATDESNVTQGGGTILNSSGVIVNPGATLVVDNSSGASTALAGASMTSRISANVPVTLNAGTLQLILNPGVGVAPIANSQKLGSLVIGPGASTVKIDYPSAPVFGTSSTVTFSSITRQAGGTINFIATNSTLDSLANRIVFTTAPTTVGNNGGILPYALVNNTDYASFDPTNGSIITFAGYVTALAAAGPGDIVKLTGPDALTANKTITALLLAGGLVGEDGFTLTLAGGGLAVNATGSVTGGTTVFGSAEGIIQTSAAAIATIDTPLTGSGGLTIGGAGTTVLPNANPGLSGGVTLAGGTLQVGNGSALGSGTITLINGTVTPLAGITFNNAVVLNNSTLAITGNNNLTFAGPITLSDTNQAAGVFTNTLTVTNTAQTVFAGNIGGAGALFLAGTGAAGTQAAVGAGALQSTVFLTGNNTYTGNTYLTGNLITVAGSNTAFGNGAGTLYLTTGTLLAGAAGATLPNNFVFNNSGIALPAASTSTAAGFILGSSSYNGTNSGNTFNSSLTFTGTGAFDNLTFTSGVSSPTVLVVYNNTTFSNNISGPGGIIVTGPGNLVLAGTNTYAGGTVLNSSGTGVISSQAPTSLISTVTGLAIVSTATPTFTRIDPSIDYPVTTSFIPSAGFGNPPSNPPGIPGSTNAGADSLIESGYLNITTPGNYSFNLVNDDGGVAYVDGILVVDSDGANVVAPGTTGTAIPLTAGLHTVQVRINNNGTNAAGVFNYQGPDTNNVQVLVPMGVLSNPTGTTGTLQIGNSSSLGSGPVALSNGVFQLNNSVTLTNPVSFTGGALPLVLAGSNLTIAKPAVEGNLVTLSVNNTTTFDGDLAGTTGLTMTSEPVVAGSTTYTGTGGNLVFTAPVSYTGPTTVAAGTLTLSGNGTLAQTATTGAVQTISLQRVASGTFTLTYNGQTTAAITYTATAGAAGTASTIQSDLQALTNIGATGVIVTPIAASTVNNQYFLVQFTGALAGVPQPLMTISTTFTSSGTAGTGFGSVSTTTPGAAGLTIDTGGTVTLDNSGINNSNRINPAATVALNGGTLNFLGNGSAASAQTLACSPWPAAARKSTPPTAAAKPPR